MFKLLLKNLLLKICNVLVSLKILQAFKVSGWINTQASKHTPWIIFYCGTKRIFGCNDPDGKWLQDEDFSDVFACINQDGKLALYFEDYYDFEDCSDSVPAYL